MKIKKMLILFSIIILLLVSGIFFLFKYIQNYSSIYILSEKKVPAVYTVLVPGALVYKSGRPSSILEDRLISSLRLYQKGKVKRFLLSGDHGREAYDEVNNMKKYLIKKGVPTSDIFLDHAGFDTYDSIVRAKEIFGVKDMIIVSQKFHLSRAIFIARSKGLDAYGVPANNFEYRKALSFRNSIREKIANIKAFLEVSFNIKPHFLGEKIPITGDSRLSYD